MITIEDAVKEISVLDISAAIQATDIPVKVIKSFNESVVKGKFPIYLKLANTISVFKKGAITLKNNNRSVSIFPVFSKIFEKLLQRRLLVFFCNNLSKFQ